MPSHWGLGFNTWIWEDTNFQSRVYRMGWGRGQRSWSWICQVSPHQTEVGIGRKGEYKGATSPRENLQNEVLIRHKNRKHSHVFSLNLPFFFSSYLLVSPICLNLNTIVNGWPTPWRQGLESCLFTAVFLLCFVDKLSNCPLQPLFLKLTVTKNSLAISTPPCPQVSIY